MSTSHDVRLLLAGDDAYRNRPTVECELCCVGTQATGCSPDQHDVALLHRSAVLGDQLPVRGRVDQSGGGGLLPAEVLGFGQELVGLDHRELGEAAEVRLVAPDALLWIEHGVVVT
jgi:hypothetical protein